MKNKSFLIVLNTMLLILTSRVFAQTQLGSDIDGEAANDYSGYSVSMDSDGDRVAIGAYRNDGTGTSAGHVRVYQYSNSSWSQLGSDIDGEAAGDNFGYSVSMNSDGCLLYTSPSPRDATRCRGAAGGC